MDKQQLTKLLQDLNEALLQIDNTLRKYLQQMIK
jgi:hypothetical protein